MCFLRKGDGNLVKGLSSDIAIVPKGKQLLSIVQNINQQLNETNTKIQQLAKQAQPTYKELNQKKESENEILMKQYAQLTAERVKIDKMLDEYETLDKTQNQGTIQTNKNYYVYILLCLFAILIVFLLVKFVASSSQQNQGSMYQSGGGFFY
jgi:ATP-dependent Zn protease